MIFGTLKIVGTTLETHNDYYALREITTVSTRRPFVSAGLMTGILMAAFAFGFWDILFFGERIAALAIASTAIWGGLNIGLLQLASRDLRGLPLADAAYGTYRHLNREGRKIAAAAERAKTGDMA